MPLTERYTPSFDTGIHQKVEPELIEAQPPATATPVVASRVGPDAHRAAGGRFRSPTFR